MSKKYLLFTVVLFFLLAGGWIVFQNRSSEKDTNNPEVVSGSQCEANEMIFYYLDQCGWCQKVKQEGTISKIEKLGVKVQQINAKNISSVRHQFQGVPTFVINEKVYSDYKTFEELSALLGCPIEENQSLSQGFKGEQGALVVLTDGQLILGAEALDDGFVRYYNTKLSSGKIVYFFVIKDKAGIYRAAANACQVCFDARMGFSQEGDFMVCNTCGNKYSLEKIATEKGGCNPGPINPNLKVKNGKITINQSELEQITDLF